MAYPVMFVTNCSCGSDITLQIIGGLIPGSSSKHAEVYLSKTLNAKLQMNYVRKSLWTKVPAKLIECNVNQGPPE